MTSAAVRSTGNHRHLYQLHRAGKPTETAPTRATCRGRLCRNSGCWPRGKVGQPRFLHQRYKLGRLFAAIPLGPFQALILSLRITDGFGQHLAQLGLGLCGFPREAFYPCGHGQYVGM